MRAAVLTSHDLRALSVTDISTPKPGLGEVAVRVETVGVNQLDLNVIAGIGPGVRATMPRILGIDPAGTIVGVGEGVSADRIGDAVVVKPNIPCGSCAFCAAGAEEDCPRQQVIGMHRDGGAAEVVVVPSASAISRGGVDAAQATAVMHSAAIVLNAIETAEVRSDERVLVTGASGTLGRAAVAIALHRGAQVTAASRRPIATIGPERTITAEDTASLRTDLAQMESFDVVIDVSGNAPTLGIGVAALGWSGRAVFCSASVNPELRIDARDFYLRRKSLRGTASAGYRHVREALALAASGVLPNLVGERYPLVNIAQAYAAFPTKKNGKVIIDVL